jgi:ATP-dependent helicase/nuclease subunit A
MIHQHDAYAADQLARKTALDPGHSYIVQAPAGSGKTELLTQRYLKLLSTVNKSPEEVIAITFTRKAAAEMRTRVIKALNFAENNPKPEQGYLQTTWQLAKTILDIDHEKQWCIQQNPNRLRILTIDALAAMISSQIPLSSGFGAQPNITEDTQHCYHLAIKELYETFEKPQAWHAALETLLLHLDNNAERLAGLFTQLLAKRDQWLPHIIAHFREPDVLKGDLELALYNIIFDKLNEANESLPYELKQRLFESARFAATVLCEENPEHELSACLELSCFPDATPENLPLWQAILNLLLTRQGSFRKTVDKRLGFPASEKAHKQNIQNILTTLREDQEIATTLYDIMQCPPAIYTQGQWGIIEALLTVLPILTAQLHVIFRRYNLIDFTELTLGALRALGDENNPTDLALYLDYQVKHILVDEFQDTSIMQYRLLEQITAGWQANDGRTLFLVGDPMQSIYRFRNAEVSLFLRAQKQGIGQISVIPLSLQLNFRSHGGIIDWVNLLFEDIFPKECHLSSGAVSFSPATATQETEREPAVHYYPSIASEEPQHCIATLIKQYQTQSPTDSIAILVRSRQQLKVIIPLLYQHNISFNAVEIETLAHRMEIQDLVSLTQALLHLGDRVAWLAILRAPWCGLTLSDLHSLAQQAMNRPLWSVLDNSDKWKHLSDDGKQRLQAIVPAIRQSLQLQGKLPLAEWIKKTWIALNAPASFITEEELNNTETFFCLVENIEAEFSLSLLQRKLSQLFAKPTAKQTSTLQIMTIHKSKGLEFDHVILPELHRKTPADSNQLLMWLERANTSGGNDLLLAPIAAPHQSHDPLHTYLKQIEKSKLDNEAARLLYVATTRAKKTLHLYLNIEWDPSKSIFKPPAKGCFANFLWNKCHPEFLKSLVQNQSHIQTTEAIINEQKLNRLVINWPPNETYASLRLWPETTTEISHTTNTLKPLNFSHYLGTALHECLAKISESRQQWNPENLQPYLSYCDNRLRQLGTPPQLVKTYSRTIFTALQSTLRDPKGNWILQTHSDGQCELPLTGLIHHKTQHCIIDRTFIDEDNNRWIIDYKSSTPDENSDVSDFLEKQKQTYQQQLQNYGLLMSSIESRPIRLGLYFPLCQLWVDWAY